MNNGNIVDGTGSVPMAISLLMNLLCQTNDRNGGTAIQEQHGNVAEGTNNVSLPIPNQNLSFNQNQSIQNPSNQSNAAQSWSGGSQGIQSFSMPGLSFSQNSQMVEDQSQPNMSQAVALFQAVQATQCGESSLQGNDGNNQFAQAQSVLNQVMRPEGGNSCNSKPAVKESVETEEQKSADFTSDDAKNKSTVKFVDTSVIRLPSPASNIRRFPCRARGMPLDHNAKTAFYDIPDSMAHGTELTCSHLLCQTQGVKFQFCIYCDRPVAKRNFRNRHMHIDEAYPDDGFFVATVEEFSRKRRINELASPSLDVHVAKTSQPSGVGDFAAVSVGTRDFSTNSSSTCKLSKSTRTTEGSRSGNSEKSVAAGSKVICKEEEEIALSSQDRSHCSATQWMTLLKKRPLCNNNQATVEWLDEILESSSRHLPFSHSERKTRFRDIAIEYLKERN